jgi:hypothetical protein
MLQILELFTFPFRPEIGKANNDKYQFCHRRPGKEDFYSKLREIPGRIEKDFPDASELQIAALRMLANVSYAFPLGVDYPTKLLTTTLGSVVLQVVGSALPDDQWMKKVKLWDKQLQTAIRLAVADYAKGPMSRD